MVFRKEKESSRKGSTLMELVIVMAVLAIVVASTSSFIGYMARITSYNSINATVVEDRTVVRALISAWVSEHDSEGAVFGTDNDGNIWAYSDSSLYEIKLDLSKKVVKASFNNNEVRSVPINRVTELKFEVLGNGAEKSGRRLICCKVTYLTERETNGTYKLFFSTVVDR